METLVDLSSTSSTWLLETDRWLIWTLGEQREIRKGVGGLGKGKGVFCHISTSCHPALPRDAVGKALPYPPGAESSFT